MFYEKMEKILPDLKVIITDGKTQTMYPLDSFNSTGTTSKASSNKADSEE